MRITEFKPGYSYLIQNNDSCINSSIEEKKFLKESKNCICFEVEEDGKLVKEWYIKEYFINEYTIIEELKNEEK